MSDPLSIVAGVAGLLSLGIQVTQSLVGFYASYKGQDSTVHNTLEKLKSLEIAFRYLESSLSKRDFQSTEQSLIDKVTQAIQSSDELIRELDEECKKLRTSSSPVGTLRRVAYPFRQSTLQKLDEDIGDITASIEFALNVLQFEDTRKVQEDISDISSLLNLIRADQVSSKSLAWLKAPDVSINHNGECAKAHPRTGEWFVKGTAFTRWLTEEDNTFLWLTGFPGSGKSVLCSTAIQFTYRHKKSDPEIGIAFFYFTFRDDSK